MLTDVQKLEFIDVAYEMLEKTVRPPKPLFAQGMLTWFQLVHDAGYDMLTPEERIDRELLVEGTAAAAAIPIGDIVHLKDGDHGEKIASMNNVILVKVHNDTRYALVEVVHAQPLSPEQVSIGASARLQ